MVFTAVLHLHSRYAYACSKDLILTNMVLWAKAKGIELLSTADFTHPAWLSELESNLISTKDGDLYLREYDPFWDQKSAVSTNKAFALGGFICWFTRRI